MSGVGSLAEQAAKRKERLKGLRGKQDGEELAAKRAANDGQPSLPKPVFRSYNPHDATLKEAKLPAVKPTEVTEHVKEQLEASEAQTLVEEIDLVKLAPRKPDWDLKRDVAKKLEKLDRRTQRAIAELIRDRLQQGKGDLATAVSGDVPAVEEEDDD